MKESSLSLRTPLSKSTTYLRLTFCPYLDYFLTVLSKMFGLVHKCSGGGVVGVPLHGTFHKLFYVSFVSFRFTATARVILYG